MKSDRTIKLLTVSDVHQVKTLFGQLADAVHVHQPDIVVCVGDVLDAVGYSSEKQFTTVECSTLLARLPVKHLVFVRGNHEDTNWTEFVAAWPRDQRPLHALYGTAFRVGPLVIVGFPCFVGSEFSWCAHLESRRGKMKLSPVKPSEELSTETDLWLPRLMHRLGPAGRTLWLMHEPPMGPPLGEWATCNQLWALLVERFAPQLVISGHDHKSPIANGVWHKRLGSTTCVNVGQSEKDLHYTVAEFEFSSASPTMPVAIQVQAFPRGECISV